MHEYMKAALTQIKQARLPRAHHRTARELLDHVGSDGQLELSTMDALTICGIGANGTMRAHLIALKNAGVITYRINNGQITVSFLAWTGSANQTEVEHV